VPDLSPSNPNPYDPDGLAATIAQARRKYLEGQKLLIDARNADELLQRNGHALPPESSVRRVSIEQQLDAIAEQIRQAEAVLAAHAVAAGGAPLTPSQAGKFLLALKASDANLALYHAEPEEMTAMLNHLLTSLEGSAEVRLGLIATHMR
jgi:anti-sigma-K factor RskA